MGTGTGAEAAGVPARDVSCPASGPVAWAQAGPREVSRSIAALPARSRIRFITVIVVVVLQLGKPGGGRHPDRGAHRSHGGWIPRL
ncbi:hypothetical protein CATMQ487_07530 [Sphaerotilus microaerophilus]|uniref:Uncharacterized protein n=1 Tax=Sphaerotilus microaerophilus TaxID=2914710 RepID=A0ABN6PJ46_9BURK|nr:hypothetical protein CATMQ487_07530 [Sphaerotilus sp. FB-5]